MSVKSGRVCCDVFTHDSLFITVEMPASYYCVRKFKENTNGWGQCMASVDECTALLLAYVRADYSSDGLIS